MTLGTTVVSLAALGWFVTRTDVGLGMRAAAEDMGAAHLVGLDVTREILTQGHLQTGEERWAPTPILSDRVARGELGRKTGKGFYESKR